MQLEFGFICDYALYDGVKVSALGIGFDTIYASEVPCVHPTFHLVVQLRASVAEVGDKDISIRLIDADGADVIKHVTGVMNVPQPLPGTIDSKGVLVVGFGGVSFPKYGDYTLFLTVQGQDMARIPIRIAQPPQPPATI